MEQRLKSYFENYPASDKVYVTKNKLFHTEENATSYDSKEVKCYTREEIMLPKPKEAEGGKVEIPEGFEELPYNDLKALAASLKLETADQKKETLIAAIAAAKTKED